MKSKLSFKKLVSLFALILLISSSSFAFGTKKAAAATVISSLNWSGYEMQGASYSGVEASWTLPTSVTPTSSVSANAEWIGIGGMGSHDLIQAGTMATFNNGQLSYTAWAETLPAAAQPLSIGVKEGDSVSVSLKETSSNMWEIKFKNNTTGEEINQNIPYTSSHSSAEWIEELPIIPSTSAFSHTSAGLTGGLPTMADSSATLSNFNTVHFTSATATGNNSTYGLSDGKATTITMINSGKQVIAKPGPVNGNGGFDVERLMASAPQVASVSQPQPTRVPQSQSDIPTVRPQNGQQQSSLRYGYPLPQSVRNMYYYPKFYR